MENKDKPTDEENAERPQCSRTRTISEDSQSDESKEKRQCMEMPSDVQHNGLQLPGVPASPPKIVSVEQISQAADVFSNMALAHEIAVNKDFVLEKPSPESQLQSQVKEVVHKAFWDVFEAQLLERPPNYTQALVLLAEIKEMMLGILLPHQVRMRSQIEEILDLKLIKKQLDKKILDFRYYAKFIVIMMARLCAPVRDEKIQELTKITHVVTMYKEILETLELMKLDMANFTLQQLRPHIQQHSVEYERRKFYEFLHALKNLETPVDGLELTKKWLHEVYVATANQERSSSSAENLEISNSLVITKAYVNMFDWRKDALFPETLQMDQVRFLPLKDELLNIVLAASILLVTYSSVGQSIQGISSLKSQLKDQLFILLKGVSDNSPEELKPKLHSIALHVIKQVNKCLEEHGFDQLDEEKSALILAQITEIYSDNHSVRVLIRTRILEFIEQVLKTPNIASAKYPIGLSSFYNEVSNFVGQFAQLAKHNRATFCDIYNELLNDIKEKEVSRKSNE